MKKIKGNGKALKKRGVGWGLKRIPTKPRRLSPSALGKGELEGSWLRLAKRLVLLQSCQNYMCCITAENGGGELCMFNASEKRMGGFLVILLGSF